MKKLKVSLLDYTGSGRLDASHYAAALLVFTKNTRLTMNPEGLRKYLDMPIAELWKELEYMANTIPSSWEFVDYTFVIEDVTRAFTHQFVRTRTASFAQQTMRVLDVSEGPGWDYLTGPSIVESEGLQHIYDQGMSFTDTVYKELIKNGAAIEDARGILPTNILTNIVAKMNMRTFVDVVRKRSSSRTQGEYRDVLEDMKTAVRAVHPWIDLFIERTFDKAANDLDNHIRQLPISIEEKRFMIKLIDQMRALS